jgi:hypothetical protein
MSKSRLHLLVLLCCAALFLPVFGAIADSPKAMTLKFDGKDYQHRWSMNDQNEFTPPGQTDLDKWQDMVTIDLHPQATTRDQLADVANRIHDNYQQNGKILAIDAKAATKDQPAEYFMAAVLHAPGVLEAAFARVMLVDGVGMAAVYSHRTYGDDAAAAMSKWLQANGPSVQKTLMAWDGFPKPAALKQLPQNTTK